MLIEWNRKCFSCIFLYFPVSGINFTPYSLEPCYLFLAYSAVCSDVDERLLQIRKLFWLVSEKLMNAFPINTGK